MKLTILTGPNYDELYKTHGNLSGYFNKEVKLIEEEDIDKYPSLKLLCDIFQWKIDTFVNDLYDGYSGILLDELELHNSHVTLFANTIVELISAGFVFTVTTQSDIFMNAIRVAVKQRRIDSSEVEIKFFTDVVKTIKIDEDGRIAEYPEGFMDEFDKLLMEIL